MAEALLGHLDDCGGELTADKAVVGVTGPVMLRGWVCSADARPVDSVRIVTDANVAFEAWYGHDRPDIAAVFGGSALKSGFFAVLPAECVHAPDTSISIVARVGNVEECLTSVRLVRAEADGQLYIDSVIYSNGHSVDSNGLVVQVQPVAGIALRGWAVDRFNGALATLDGIIAGQRCSALIGSRRDDVSKVIGVEASLFSGFRLRLPPIESGVSELHFEGCAADGTRITFPHAFQILGSP
jgi:hypothetical protein